MPAARVLSRAASLDPKHERLPGRRASALCRVRGQNTFAVEVADRRSAGKGVVVAVSAGESDTEREPVPDLRLAFVAAGMWAAVLACLYTSVWWGVAMAVVGAAAAAGCLRRARSWTVVLAAVAIGVAAGATTTSAQLMVRDAQPFHGWAVDNKTATLTVTVTDDPRRVKASTQPTFRVPVEVSRARVGSATVELSVRAVVFGTQTERSSPDKADADHNRLRWAKLLPGQQLTVRGRLTPGKPGDLDAATVSVHSAPKLRAEPPWWQTVAGDMRAGLRHVCADLPAEPGGLLPGLAVGDVSAMEADVDADFREAGMTHLLAVSGSNVAIVVGAAVMLAAAAGAGSRVRAVLGIAVIVCFVVLVRPSPSVLRAAVMGGLGLLVISRRGGRAVPVLSAAVAILLLIDPGLAADLGFVLSVVATAGLVFFASRWSESLRLRGWPGWLATAVAVPAAAQLAVTPVLAAATGTITPIAVFANALAAVAVPPATVLAVAATVIGPIWTDAASVLVWLAAWPARWLVFVADQAARVPMGSLPWPSGVVAGLGLAVCLLVCLMALRWRTGRRFLLVALLGVVVGTAPVRLLSGGWPPPGWVLVACDVGQGDALILPTTGSGVVVVDTGPDPDAVDACLRSLGVDRVALLVFSHLHADHVGGISGVFRGRKVEAVLPPSDAEPAMGRQRVAEATNETPAIEARAGTTIRLGRTRLRVMAAGAEFSGTRSDPNNNSIVLRASVGGTSILLSGDMEEPAQRAVLASGLPVESDVLKVPHHGSSYFADEFFEAVAPRVAVVSAGSDNDYGHPHPRALRQLASQGAEVFRTDRDGAIAVAADGGLEVMTES